jgi:hypothetical protein
MTIEQLITELDALRDQLPDGGHSTVFVDTPAGRFESLGITTGEPGETVAITCD